MDMILSMRLWCLCPLFLLNSVLFIEIAEGTNVETTDRVSIHAVDDRSVVLHAVIDEHLDLATRLARHTGEIADPLVTLPPRLVVGQGEHRSNRTVVRVLNRYGLAEAQFLAFDPKVSGGVRVAAGRDREGRVIVAATPASPRPAPKIRLFNAAGGFRHEFVPAGVTGTAVYVQAGDFLSDHPGDELAVVPDRGVIGDTTSVALYSLDGEPIQTVFVPIANGQLLTLSSSQGEPGMADQVWVHARPDHTLHVIDFARGEVHQRQISGLKAENRVYPGADASDWAVAAGNEPVLSRVTRIASDGATTLVDVGQMENRFWIVPGDWSASKGDAYVRVADSYGHFRMDLGNPKLSPPELWDRPGVWSHIGEETTAKWRSLLRPLDEQPLRMWEPTITHRMNWDRALPWARRTDSSTGLPRFLALTNRDKPASYGEFGRKNQFHNFTYAYGDTALDQLYAVPLRQFLRRLALRFREHPERVISLEPVHEHEISVGGKGSVGDYHPLMIRGFRDYVRRLQGEDTVLRERFGLPGNGSFDAPRGLGRGQWDRYDTANPFYQQWLLYQRYIVNRRIADGYYAALAAGFPPEIIKGHQIPDVFAAGSTETFSERRARITPVDYALTAGVGFGYTRYGVWFKEKRNMLRSATSSGFQSVAMGEYQSLTGDAELAFAQLKHLFENGVTAVHVMHWPESHDKGFNAAMREAIARLLKHREPRPGLTGGVGRVAPVALDGKIYSIAVIGAGPERTGLLKSLWPDGSWQGAVYSVPFRSAITVSRLPRRIMRLNDGYKRYLVPLDEFDVGEQAEVTFSGSDSAERPIRFNVLCDGKALPGYGTELPTRADQTLSYRLTLRNQLPTRGIEIAIDLPADFNRKTRFNAYRCTERVARLHRGEYEGDPHRGSLEFAIIPMEPARANSNKINHME